MAIPISKVWGVGAQTAEVLKQNGYKSAESLAVASEEALATLHGFGFSRARKVIAAAKELVSIPEVQEEPVVSVKKKNKEKPKKEKKQKKNKKESKSIKKKKEKDKKKKTKKKKTKKKLSSKKKKQ